MRGAVRRGAAVVAFVGIVGVLVEIALRVAPGALIPLRLLERFEPSLRDGIARELGLNTASQTWILERDDGGPLLRLFKPHATVSYDVGDGIRHSYAMDELGFCNAARDAWSRAQIDVLAIGDSFTACLIGSPEATWPSQLGQLLGLSTYNFGLSGIGPYEYVQILRRFGLSKHPRVVVMHLYEGNDLRDALFVQAARGAPRPVALGGAERYDLAPVLDHPLGRNSRAVDLAVVWTARALEGLRPLRSAAAAAVDFRYELRLGERVFAFNPQNTDQDEVRHARALQLGAVSLAVFDEPLERFAAMAREHGFVPIVSYAPSAHTVYAPFVHFADPALAELMPWFSAAQRRHLAERAGALGLVWVDQTPAFQAAARERQGRDLLYEATALHCSVSGHRLSAEILAQVIRGLGLVAASPADAATP